MLSLIGWTCANNPQNTSGGLAVKFTPSKSSRSRMENLYCLEIDSLDLGADVRAVGLELLEPETREPVKGSEGDGIWAALVPALAGGRPWALAFLYLLD